MATETEAAVSLATRLPDIRFPEFTAKLITDTMDAVVSAMIRQMEAYSKLLGSVAKTLEDFEKDEITEEEVDQWLASNFPNPSATGDTALKDLHLIRKDTDYTIANGVENLPIKQLLDAEIKETGVKYPAGEQTPAEPPPYAAGKLTDGDVANIRTAVKRKLARSRLSVLQELVKMGIVRIIVDEGKIYTKLTFDVTGTQFHERVKNQYEKKQWGVGGRASFVGKLFAIGVGGGYSSVKVKSVKETDFGRVDARVTIVGGVDISFRTDYSPLAP